MVTKNLQYDHIITKAEPDDANFKPHSHNVYELEYIFNIENGEFAFGHNKYAVKSDTLIVCPPMSIHNMCFLNGQEFDRIVIRFNDEFLSDDLTEILNSAYAIYAFNDTWAISSASRGRARARACSRSFCPARMPSSAPPSPISTSWSCWPPAPCR